MENIKQLTNRDLINLPSVDKVIMKAEELTTYPYKIITTDMLKGIITKLGYCCEPKGIGYPIFLTFQEQEEQAFQIGKTGMFEFQPETWINVNGGNIERTAIVHCIEVAVPADITFTLDYWCGDN